MLTLIKQMVQLHPDLTELIEKMQSAAPKQQRIPFNPELHCRQVKAKSVVLTEEVLQTQPACFSFILGGQTKPRMSRSIIPGSGEKENDTVQP